MKKYLFFLLTCFLASSVCVASSKIISLAPDLTEIVFSLGLQEHLIATTEFSDYPEAAKKITQVGSFIRPNLEKIMLLKPTLVLARTGGTPGQISLFLKKKGIEVLSFPARDESDIFETVKRLGKKFKKEKKSHKLILKMKRQLKEIQNKTKGLSKLKVLVQVEENPLMVAGRNTLIHRAIELAGGTNAAFNYQHYPKLQREMILKLNPDIIVIPSMGSNQHKAKRMLKQWKKRRVYIIDGDLLARATPRFIEGIQQLHRILHP